jgi:hypothetical protein
MDFTITGGRLRDPGRNQPPFLLNWSRLEALPVTPDIELALQAVIGDPLWMLGRQWQFNEFQGEDAGTPIDARLEVEQARLDRIRPGKPGQAPSAGARDFQPLALPLEVVVEAEAEPRINARMAADAGLQCLRRLRGAGLDAAAASIRKAYPLTVPSVDPSTDSSGAAWIDLLDGRATDGVALAAALRPFLQPDGTLNGLPPISGIDPAGPNISAIRKTLAVWLAEHLGSIERGFSTQTAWTPERQEYVFAARASLTGGKRVMLDASEYAGGHLDWHSFAAADDPGLGNPAVAVPAAIAKPSPKLPVPVRYPGMPADRYWEFEDSPVSFGRVGGGPTDVMRALLVEFALIYGNDWFYVPFEVPVGSLCSIASLKVRDTFGVETSVPAVRESGRPWKLFELSSTGGAAERRWFFLAPALASRLQGDPVEEVAWFRDEMANMAWAVERRIPGAIDGAVDRALERYDSRLHQQISGDDITAEVAYRLQTDVPDRWIPFVPVAQAVPGGQQAFNHVLERRTLIRTRADGSRAPIHPRGTLLRTDPAQAVDAEPALRLAEEEVPREGAVTRRAFQYTRWLDGTSHVWLGREKTTGRGEGASDLHYDLLVRVARK